jgi:hypothetical protein
MSATNPQPPRLRQAVLAAQDLEAVVARLRQALSLGEPFSDPGVAHFGLRNAVFAIGDTFLEVVSPARADTAAGRLLERRGGDCGYMLMFQVSDLSGARARAAERGIREVFEVDLPEISEVHLHPADIGGAIVSLSEPRPPESWRWGGPEWHRRNVPGAIAGVTIAVRDPDAVAERWEAVLSGLPGVRFVRDDAQRGPVEVAIAGLDRPSGPLEVAGVQLVLS